MSIKFQHTPGPWVAVIRGNNRLTVEAVSGGLHPIFAGIVASIQTAPVALREAQRRAYVTLLQRHDWSHEFSDDRSAYTRGREQLAELRLVQREIDPDFEIWNQHCPPQCVNGRIYQ